MLRTDLVDVDPEAHRTEPTPHVAGGALEVGGLDEPDVAHAVEWLAHGQHKSLDHVGGVNSRAVQRRGTGLARLEQPPSRCPATRRPVLHPRVVVRGGCNDIGAGLEQVDHVVVESLEDRRC